MAHFAELDENNVVLRVVVVHDNDAQTEDKGRAFCEHLFGGRWVQTSYNGRVRKRYAGVGYSYNASLDAFIPPKPYPSWVLDTEQADWVPPVPRPDDGGSYQWDEDQQQWRAIPTD